MSLNEEKSALTSDKEIIPIMHCFDDNYVIPAGVSFLSMLENANSSYFYKLFVLHTDISKKHQEALCQIVESFDNASLAFIDMKDRFKAEFNRLKTKGHYAKEFLYKLLVPSIFAEYEDIIITDVDVVFVGDVSKVYECGKMGGG